MPLAYKDGALVLKGNTLGLAGDVNCGCCYECGLQTYSSGVIGLYSRDHSLPPESGQVTFSWWAFRIRDRFAIEMNGVLLYDSGPVSGSGTFTFCKPLGVLEVKILVYGDVDNFGSTAWEYALSCPAGSC